MADIDVEQEPANDPDRQELSVESIFYFAEFAATAESYQNPTTESFRTFAERTKRSHGFLTKTVDRVEYHMQRLVMERNYRDEDGARYRAADYAEAQAVGGKRTKKLTRYGLAFGLFAKHTRELYDFMVEEEDVSAIMQVLRRQSDLLKRYRRDPNDDGSGQHYLRARPKPKI